MEKALSPHIQFDNSVEPFILRLTMKITDDSFEKGVKRLFETNKSGLTNDDIKFIEECIMYGESGLAYETTIAQLYEHNILISRESYDLIEEIGKAMNHSESYWLPLKQLIKSEK